MHGLVLGGAAAAMLFAAAGTANAQFLMVPESSNDNIMLFNAFDGSLISMNFLDLTPADPGTPVNAIQVGNEIWVSDQLRDRVDRFSVSSGFLGTFAGGPGGGLDNIRGMAAVGNTLYVTSSGTNEGAPGESTVMFDITTGENLGSFFSDDSFDVVDTGSGLLINDIDDEDIFSYNYDGSGMTLFHDSDGVDGVDFPEQMNLGSNDTLWVAGFSSPAGVYQYDLATGDQIAYFDVGGVRGVYELGNGNVMYTSGDGVFVLDPDTGFTEQIVDGVSGRFIEPTSIPGPGALALVGLTGLLGRRRRR